MRRGDAGRCNCQTDFVYSKSHTAPQAAFSLVKLTFIEEENVVHYDKLIYMKCKTIMRIFFIIIFKVYGKKITKTNIL